MEALTPARHARAARRAAPEPARDYAGGMSDNVAYALLVYTGLQIFMTVQAMKSLGETGGASILPYMALVVLVAGIIPACRWFERRWTAPGAVSARGDNPLRAYRRDQVLLWLLAIGLPGVLTALFYAVGGSL